jgi:NitT/TauT family transport system ATP-binding protein
MYELQRIWYESKKAALLVTHDMEEAIFLSNRVVILSERPAKIKKILEVDLSRPRKKEVKLSSKFIKLKHEVGLEIGSSNIN